MTQAPIPASMAPNLLVPNVVLLRNEGDRDFEMRYGPKDWLRLAAGKQVMVVEEVAWHYLGRWWTDNSNPRQRARQMEVDRLRVLFGAYEDEALWEANRPRLTAWTPDGERITTVIDDPEGTAGGRTTPFARSQSLETQIEMMAEQQLRMTATIEALRQELDNRRGDDAPVESPAPVTAPTFPGPPPSPTAELAPGLRVPVSNLPTIPDPESVDGTIDEPMDAPSPGNRLEVTPELVEIPTDEPTKTRVSARGS